MLSFSGKAAFALQGPSQGGVAAETHPGTGGEGLAWEIREGNKFFSFVTKNPLHALPAATNFAVKITISISCFSGSHVGHSSPSSELIFHPMCCHHRETSEASSTQVCLHELLAAKFSPLWKKKTMRPPYALQAHGLDRTAPRPLSTGMRHFVFPRPRKTTGESRWLFGSLELYTEAVASPAPADAALLCLVLLCLGRMRSQQRCEYRSPRS